MERQVTDWDAGRCGKTHRLLTPMFRRIPWMFFCVSGFIAAGWFQHRAAAAVAETSEQTAAEADPRLSEKIEFFEARIRPVLVTHCYSCHADGAAQVRGGLLLDSREGLLAGGDSGPAIVPGKPQQSLLLQALRHESLEMPPDQRLSENVIADFEAWIADGATDPRVGGTVRRQAAVSVDEGRQFWCFQPVMRPVIPQVQENCDWVRTDIDRLLAASWRHHQVAPAADASAEQLARRLYLVLIGLPPTPEQTQQFVDAWQLNTDAAVASLTDTLLQSPHFGERWGRHWLDVTRFAESSGGGRSLMFPEAWRFRDYVIRSFQQDKPFNQLLKEHIAGDLLPYSSDIQRDQQRTGAGYLILGAINYEEQDKETLRMDVVDEQIDTIGRTFLGMTLGCARCHDHKFDPVPTADYYALAGIFRSTQSLTPGNVSGYVTASLGSDSDKAAMEQWERREKELKRQLAAHNSVSGSPTSSAELRSLKEELQNHIKAKPYIPYVMTVRDDQTPADWHVQIRGGVRNLGPVVPRSFLSVAMKPESVGAVQIPTGTSGRVQLAEWLVSAEHPLTSRVFVNRVWMHLIGEGLVRTPDNFGKTGELPTHPELLDYLADSFMNDDHWSVKQLIRRICVSRVFRLSSEGTEQLQMTDPENRLLTRGFRRRIDAETLRDSMLQVSGQLDLSVSGGRTIGEITEYDVVYDHQKYPLMCRSVYVPFFRNAMLDLFYVFDTANPNVVTGRRTEGTLPSQALFMMNSDFVIQQADLAARRFLASTSVGKRESRISQIERTVRLVLCRAPTEQEKQLLLSVLAESKESEQQAWSEVFHALFGSLDFRFVD
jgi:hypothetical protein